MWLWLNFWEGTEATYETKNQISKVDGADDTEDEGREEIIPLTASEMDENNSRLEECKSLPVGNKSKIFDLGIWC